MRISDWSSDVCSSDLANHLGVTAALEIEDRGVRPAMLVVADQRARRVGRQGRLAGAAEAEEDRRVAVRTDVRRAVHRSEEHTSELQSLMRISYAVFCLKKKTNTKHEHVD